MNAKFFFISKNGLNHPCLPPFSCFISFTNFIGGGWGDSPPYVKRFEYPEKRYINVTNYYYYLLDLQITKRVSHFLCIMTTFLKGYNFIFALLCSLYIDNRPTIIWSICKSRIFVFCSYLYDCSLLEYIHVSLPCFCMFLHVKKKKKKKMLCSWSRHRHLAAWLLSDWTTNANSRETTASTNGQ